MAADDDVIVIVDDPVFEQLIDPGAELVKIGEGYQFSEGPVWNQREQALYFSDIPGDARWRWTATAGWSWRRHRPSRATGWRSTSTAACWCASRSRAASLGSTPTDAVSSSPGTSTAST